MIKFSKNMVLLLHKLVAQETGGSIGVRDEGLLESALEAAFSGFGDKEFYYKGLKFSENRWAAIKRPPVFCQCFIRYPERHTGRSLCFMKGRVVGAF